MLHMLQHLPPGCSVACQLVRDEYARHILAALEELAEELFGSTLVPATLHQYVQHVALLVFSPPQVVRLPVDLEEDFVQMPLIPWSGPTMTQLVGVGLPELQAPLADRFVGDNPPRAASSSSTSR